MNAAVTQYVLVLLGLFTLALIAVKVMDLESTSPWRLAPYLAALAAVVLYSAFMFVRSRKAQRARRDRVMSDAGL
ncbi:hypothetical protein JSO19_08065 [Leucobacter sp. UCMA 4100]|uniref:hypothetical protein n=1 Tax=Leucobacter sp. UCMA 4100 TaxID=2810534 RepID=UPI0022EA76AF|nr:hypothetical protein [Leucobacter sp. UCMA 4100]MDA3147335.1 hypothetical protein [Leucobacter sp. UCMA 4100]